MPDSLVINEELIKHPRRNVQHNVDDQKIVAKYMMLYGYESITNAFSVLIKVADKLHDNDPELFRKLLSNNSPD